MPLLLEIAAGVFVVFLVVSVILPAMSRLQLEGKRQTALRDFDADRGSRTISTIHRQEAISFAGVALSRFIDIEDSEAIVRAIRTTDDDVSIDLILHTPGGEVLAAE